MTRRFNLFLLAMALLFGLPYYWLMLDNSSGGAAPLPVRMADLRALAASKSGPAPDSVGMVLVAHRLLPGNLVAAGSGMKRRNLGRIAFVLPTPGGAPLLIEPGLAIGPEAGIRVSKQHLDAAARVDHVRRQAALVVSMEGQAADREPYALAPGVVAIPAPSHSARTRMIYVRLANGAEYLFAGDVAPMALSWQEQRGRARLVSDWLVPEDRHAVFAWLRTIRRLKQEAPDLHVIPGYDYEWLVDPRNRSGIL